MRRFANAALVAAFACLLAACGGGSSSSAPAAASSSSAPALTAAQGTQICNDLNTWIVTAYVQDQPRFDATMQADESEAQADNSTLGIDLAAEDSDLQAYNGLATINSPINNQQGVANTEALSADCSNYGVTINWSPSIGSGSASG